jgi:hypothetical protein
VGKEGLSVDCRYVTDWGGEEEHARWDGCAKAEMTGPLGSLEILRAIMRYC